MEESVFSSSTATNSDENEDENWSDINTDDEADDDNGLSYFDKWILHMMYDNRYFQIAR